MPRAVLAIVDEGVGRWGGARLDVKGEWPRDCCCVTITADNSGEFDVTGRDWEVPGGKNAPLPIRAPIAPIASLSADDTGPDIPMAPISIPPLPPVAEDTPPIQDGKDPPPNASTVGKVVATLGNEGEELTSHPSTSCGR